MNRFLAMIDRLRHVPALQIFTIYLRYLIGGAFVIAAFAMGKFSGATLLNPARAPIETLLPIQQFFRVMADSGLYWKFIGLTQVIGGGLLMTQRFSKLGALIFFGLILNIFVITISYGFQGTPIVTGLMLLATIYLLIWDLDSYQFIFRSNSGEEFFRASTPLIIHQKFWTALGSIMFISIVVLGILRWNMLWSLGTAFLTGLAGFVFYFSIIHRRVNAAIIASDSTS